MHRRRPLAALLAAAALTTSFLLASAPTAGAEPAAVALPTPKADIVVDAQSGKVLVCDNIHESMHPASTAKILTAIVGVERIPAGGIVSADPNTNAIPENKVGFPPTSKWPLEEMLASMMMVSANDAAYAVAHTVGGNLDNFANILNQTAKRLGLKESVFNDPSGLDNWASYKGGPFTTAYDLAILARDARATPAIAKWAGTVDYAFTDPAGTAHQYKNHNRMLPGGAYAYAGADGFKTGYTDRAQHTLVTSATRNGKTLIAVVLGAVDAGYQEAANLLDAAFASTGKDAAGKPVCGGAVLPPNRVSVYSSRAGDQSGFAALARTPGTAVAAPTTTPANAAAVNAVKVPARIQLSDTPRAASPANTTIVATRPSHSLLSMRNIMILLILLGFALVMLRRRAVRRQRAIRLARKRQRMAAIRSGGLPVVDGRYRAGLRMGPPVESHVRITPTDT